ncbi:MAG: FtsK/SpoIIIE domain-containing protein [Blautia sp.]|nr:FtsK/SpoIIIE domain-containing protein [Blautia sp.]
MKKIETIYTEIYDRLRELAEAREEAERQLQEVSVRNRQLFQELDERINADLQGITEKMSRVNVFINFAREHTSVCEMASGAIAYDTTELNRLMVLVEHSATDDMNARRLFTVATGQLKTLVAQKASLQNAGDQEKQSLRARVMPDRQAAVERKDAAVEAFRAYFQSPQCQDSLSMLKEQTVPEQTLSMGLRRADFPVPEELTEVAAETLGDLWDRNTQSISIPVTIGVEEGNVCVAEYTNQTENEVLSGIRDILLKGIGFTGGEPQYICVFDPVRYNDSALGTLEPLALGESRLIDRVPTSKEELQRKLDDIINKGNLEDQLAARNEKYERAVKFYVFHNFPQGYDASMQTKVRQLCVNAPHGRMNIFLTHNCSEDENRFMAQNETYNYLREFGRIITVAGNEYSTDWDKNGNQAPFWWNQAPSRMPEDLLERARQKKEQKNQGKNDYDAQVGIQEMPAYRKGVRRLTDIPYGVDESGQLLTLDFENSNFATFICGAARSGKSTLLHTILTGIFQQNHPDDVEVWLIDFKMTEFSRYIGHLPPHVRYIILDESPELVYDIIDRLTEILQKRQSIFKGMWQKLYDVPEEKYMPAMFIVIDEFSIMSQIIADSATSGENYSEKLQALLAKGAALGMHFIFASQGFTSGTRGLNDFSKKQIQQRIAMKTELAEIKATLDLLNASEQDYAMMEQLPVHKTLTRMPVDEYGNHLCLADVLYISDYKKQEHLIDTINANMQQKPRYDVGDIPAYIYKQPMIIDGNSYHPFSDKKDKMMEYLEKRKPLLRSEGLWDIFWGEPRRMMHVFPAQIADSYGENVFMLAPIHEKEAALSVLLSMKQSLDMQGRFVQLWTTRKHGMYQQLVGDCGWSSVKRLDLEQVCQAIADCRKKIEDKKPGNTFFILLGFESLMMDMSFQERKAAPGQMQTQTQAQPLKDFSSMFQPAGAPRAGGLDLLSQMNMKGQGGSAAVAGGQTDVTAGVQDESRFAVAGMQPGETAGVQGGNVFAANVQSGGMTGAQAGAGMPSGAGAAKQSADEPESPLYDAREDLKYILTQGPRLGYHFLMVFHTMGEFKQMKIAAGLFKHKVMFRAPKADVFEMVGAQGKDVAALGDHSFRYTNGLDSLSFRPFLHAGLSLDGWKVNEDGSVAEEVLEEENYLL